MNHPLRSMTREFPRCRAKPETFSTTLWIFERGAINEQNTSITHLSGEEKLSG